MGATSRLARSGEMSSACTFENVLGIRDRLAAGRAYFANSRPPSVTYRLESSDNRLVLLTPSCVTCLIEVTCGATLVSRGSSAQTALLTLPITNKQANQPTAFRHMPWIVPRLIWPQEGRPVFRVTNVT